MEAAARPLWDLGPLASCTDFGMVFIHFSTFLIGSIVPAAAVDPFSSRFLPLAAALLVSTFRGTTLTRLPAGSSNDDPWSRVLVDPIPGKPAAHAFPFSTQSLPLARARFVSAFRETTSARRPSDGICSRGLDDSL